MARSAAYVTGASGVLGYEVCRNLSATGEIAVTGVARSVAPFDLGPDVRFRLTGDLYGADWIDTADTGAVVIHCAGLSNPRLAFAGFQQFLAEHVTPHVQMVSSLLDRGWRGRFILISSGGTVYGDPEIDPIPENHPLRPQSFYGLQKVMLEQTLGLMARDRERGFTLVVLRVSNPYGSAVPKRGQGVIPILIDAILSERTFSIFGDGSARRDYLYIDDFCAAVRAAAIAKIAGPTETVNIGSGQGSSLSELIAQLEDLLGGKLRKAFVATGENLQSNVLDVRKAKDRLDWSPRVSLAEGLRATTRIFDAAYHRNHS